MSWLQTGEKTSPSRILTVSSCQGVYSLHSECCELEENFVVFLILWVMIHFLSFLANKQAKALQLKKKKNDPKVNANNRKLLTLRDKLSLFHISQGNTTVSWQNECDTHNKSYSLFSMQTQLCYLCGSWTGVRANEISRWLETMLFSSDSLPSQQVPEHCYQGTKFTRFSVGWVHFLGRFMDTLLYLPWRTSKDLLSSTGNSAQYSVITLWFPRRRMGGGIVREFGMDMDTLLYFTWRTNKDLLSSTGNSAPCHVAAWMGGEFGGEWIHVYVWLFTWNHNIVHQL